MSSSATVSPLPVEPLNRTGTRPAWIAAGVIFVLTLCLHLPYLGTGPLAGTEGHRALTADQMVKSGQWVLPTLYGRLYLAKPPLHHWLIAITEVIAGRGSEHIWRLPSAIIGGLQNAMLVLFAARWFGRSAGWVAGGLAMGLISLWAQQQSADIDGTNTFVSTAAALCWVELLFGKPRHRLAWSLAAGLAFGASLMVKGPAGLPVILGPILLAVVLRFFLWRGKGFSKVWAPFTSTAPATGNPEKGAKPPLGFVSLWLPILIGLAIFGGYFLAAYFAIQRLHFDFDWRGLREGAHNMAPTSIKRFATALLIGPMLFVWSLPVSLGLVLLLLPKVRSAIADPRRRLVYALAYSVLISWIVCTLSGMVNPRYGYVTLPPLAILGAAILTSLTRQSIAASLPPGESAVVESEGLRSVRIAIALTAVGLGIGGIATAVVAVKAVKHNPSVALLSWTVAGIGLVLSAVVFLWLRSGRRVGVAAAWLLPLLICVSVPFGLWRNGTRWKSSGIIGAQTLRHVVGPGGHVETGAALTFQPEIFHYAGVDTLAHPLKGFGPSVITRPCWVLLTKAELKRWRAEVGDRLGPDTPVESNGSNKNYVAWFAGPNP